LRARARIGLPALERFTPGEVATRLDHFSTPQMLAGAMALARFHARGLRHMGPEDLLHEAFTQLRTGQRAWPRGLSELRAIGKAMHSIASNARKKADYMLADDLRPAAADAQASAVLDIPTSNTDPARIAEAQCELDLARQAVRGDADMERLLEAWADGLRGKAAMQMLGWDAKRHDATRKRLLRQLTAVTQGGSGS
jgi:hypothetical protein